MNILCDQRSTLKDFCSHIFLLKYYFFGSNLIHCSLIKILFRMVLIFFSFKVYTCDDITVNLFIFYKVDKRVIFENSCWHLFI